MEAYACDINAEGLKISWFYTIQVNWGAIIENPDGTLQFLDSFYQIYADNKLLIGKTFRQSRTEGFASTFNDDSACNGFSKYSA